MPPHERAQQSTAEAPPARPTPFGIASVVAGFLLVLAGPVVLALVSLPQLAPTFGPAPLTFIKPDRIGYPDDGNSLLLMLGVLVLPAGGFSLAYLSAGGRVRRWIAGFCVVFFAIQTVVLAAAVLWITGTGLGANALVRLSSDYDTGLVTSPVALLFCLAAAAIMFVLARRTSFDAQSEEYFGEGDAVVRVRPLPLAVHTLWLLLAVALCAAVVYLPLLAVERAELLDAATTPGMTPGVGMTAAWPGYPGGDFAVARGTYAVTLGIIAGAVLSSLIKKVLYRTLLRHSIGGLVSDAVGNRWRGLQNFAHYPIAVAGGTAAGAVLLLFPTEEFGYSSDTAVAVFAGITAALVVLGVFMLSSVWKSGDDPLVDAALQQAKVADLHGSFAVPERRRRGRTRPRRPGHAKK